MERFVSRNVLFALSLALAASSILLEVGCGRDDFQVVPTGGDPDPTPTPVLPLLGVL